MIYKETALTKPGINGFEIFTHGLKVSYDAPVMTAIYGIAYIEA